MTSSFGQTDFVSEISGSLSLGEFIIVFASCEVMPHRREELDFYKRDIVEMAHRFERPQFYEYHKAFSAKAGALLHQRSIKVDWVVSDNGLYCTLFCRDESQHMYIVL